MIGSNLVTLVTFVAAGGLFLAFPTERLIDWNGPVFWVFVLVILVGGVVESMRNIALSTTVTLLIPADDRDKANGLVGTVQGLAFMVTSVFSGLSIGLLGMGWTLVIATGLTALSLGHLLTIPIPEVPPTRHESDSAGHFDVRSALEAIRAVPGLMALVLFATFNNLVGGVFMALMDPYGLTLFSVESWGIVLGVTSIGFIIGGAWVAKFGLGATPLRSLMLANVVAAVLGTAFTIREVWWLYAGGILLYMCVIPIAEAAEQTILQRVVPYRTQGRVFGFAQSVEAAASPVSAFLIGPIAQFWLIPYMASDAGKDRFGWLLGAGEARGIALVFLLAGAIMLVTVLLALASRPYRQLSRAYASAPPSEAAA
jgi:DHA3 family multidrug efflux protein-like MFS transporter